MPFFITAVAAAAPLEKLTAGAVPYPDP